MNTWKPNSVILDSINCDGLKIQILRDDIYPFIGGGSKARKALYYEDFLKKNDYNAVVTCGGIQSNHNRAIALMAARNGWKCHLCIQGSEERYFQEKGNALLNRLSGAEYELIEPEETAAAMDNAMDSFLSKGYKPYYIHGGGHDLPGGIAFVDAVKSLKTVCEKNGYKPDYIFHASGTGSTQAGIMVGLDQVGWGDVKVVGISVARQYERGRQVIVEFADMLAGHYGMNERYGERTLFSADYLFGGYEHYSQEMKSYLTGIMKNTGLVFDLTYSGKAFYGMMDIVIKHRLEESNLLFWHTGGIMNLMS